MAATQAGATSLDLYKHWSLILNNYIGRACNHVKVTKVLDPNGNVIDESQVETTIYGAISPVGVEAIQNSAGVLQVGDLTAYFLNDAGVVTGTQVNSTSVRYDMIEYGGVMYTVMQHSKTAHDDGVAVVCRYVLRKVAFE